MICLVLVLPCIATTVNAAPSLTLSLYKNNGYGMGDDMNGQWTVNAVVSSDVVNVEFYLDNQLQLNDVSAPFSWSFDTGNYTEGSHSIKAVAYNSTGETATAVSERNFVGFPLGFVVGIISLIVVVLIVSLVVAIYRIRRYDAKKRETYG